LRTFWHCENDSYLQFASRRLSFVLLHFKSAIICMTGRSYFAGFEPKERENNAQLKSFFVFLPLSSRVSFVNLKCAVENPNWESEIIAHARIAPINTPQLW
jgi:hypothetical protein